MKKKMLLNSEDVCEILNCSRSFSYRIIKKLNQELKQEGYITISGKVSRVYFEEKLYGFNYK